MSGFFKDKQYRKSFPASPGAVARDAGIQQALDADPEFCNWFRQQILAMPPDKTFLIEHLRKRWTGHRVTPQRWGANTQANMLCGLIEWMPDRVPMEDESSHARETNLIRRTHLLAPLAKPVRKKRKKPIS